MLLNIAFVAMLIFGVIVQLVIMFLPKRDEPNAYIRMVRTEGRDDRGSTPRWR